MIEKSKYPITEAARYVARHLSITENAARLRLYRRIDEGRIPVKKILGVMYIDKETMKKILNGGGKWGIC